MLTAEDVAPLRCPIDPRREALLRLDEDDGRLYCSRCPVRFPTRDGVPNLVTDDAILPEDKALHHLPCRKAAKR